MRPKTLILVLLSVTPLHCAYYPAPQNDSGVPDDAFDLTDATDGPRHCQSHQDCPEEERCLDGICLSEPPPCGEIVAPECAWGLERDECHQKLGSWECSHIDYSTCWCDCPTGQGGCPCWGPGHCRGECMSEEEILSGEECRALKMGVCTDWTMNLGCWCRADWWGGPGFSLICSD